MIDWDRLVVGPTQAVFGEPVSYTDKNGNAFVISGIFDEAFKDISMGFEPPATVESPMLGVRTANFRTIPEQGEFAVIRGGQYIVREVRVDSHGGARLMLNWLQSA
ncbi:MAG: hypothetical protein WCF85_20380 [Rhodospirillaceae bacterium]